MKRILILLLLVSCIAVASEETKQSLIKELLEVNQAKATIEQIRIQNVELVRHQIESESKQGPYADNPIMKRLIARAMEKYEAFTRERMGWERWEPRFIALYEQCFTEPQIGDLIRFYRSDGGKAWVRAMPAIAKELLQRQMAERKEMDAKVAQIMQETIEEIKAEVAKEQANQALEPTTRANTPSPAQSASQP